jgi:hypothetical protein
MEIADTPRTVDVRVFYTVDCAATAATVGLLNSVAAEMGIQIRSRTVLVASLAQANELKFLGSPTVQVNGVDIDPAARSNTNYGFT